MATLGYRSISPADLIRAIDAGEQILACVDVSPNINIYVEIDLVDLRAALIESAKIGEDINCDVDDTGVYIVGAKWSS